MVQCRKKSSHDCCSDRRTVSTVAATVTVTAAVTVPVTAAVTATAMDTHIYREKMIGAAATSPLRAGGGTWRGKYETGTRFEQVATFGSRGSGSGNANLGAVSYPVRSIFGEKKDRGKYETETRFGQVATFGSRGSGFGVRKREPGFGLISCPIIFSPKKDQARYETETRFAQVATFGPMG